MADNFITGKQLPAMPCTPKRRFEDFFGGFKQPVISLPDSSK